MQKHFRKLYEKFQDHYWGKAIDSMLSTPLSFTTGILTMISGFWDYYLSLSLVWQILFPFLWACMIYSPFYWKKKCDRTLDQRDKKDALIKTFEDLMMQDQLTGLYPGNHNNLRKDIIQAMKDSGVISKAEIYELENSNLYPDQLKLVCTKMISKLKW